MLLMSFSIAIGKDTQLRAVERIDIKSGQGIVADTCTISLPAQVRGKAYDVEKYIRRGDALEVQLGYNDQLQTEFVGYVVAIKPNSPLEIVCEDAMFLTRREVANKIFRNTNAHKIAEYVISELNKTLPADQKLTLKVDAKGFEFRTFSIHNATAFEVLDKLRQETGLAIFARGNDIHIHLQNGYNAGKEVLYDFARNIEDSNNLEYARKDETKLLVKVTGKDAKGKKVQAEYGDKGGDTRIINRPTVSSYDALRKIAEQTHNAQSYEGYRGNIKGWLQPYCEIGYTAKIKDADYPEREGKYYVTGVQTTFSASGGVREVSLGLKLS